MAIDAVTVLSLLLIIAIGLGLGATTTKDDFKRALTMPTAVGIGFTSQYFFMPLVAFSLSRIFDMKLEYAVGCILIGASPGGTTSNLFTHWTNGNVALSITMSFFSTVAAFAMLPLLIFLLIKTAYETDIKIPWANIFISLLLIVIPTIMGLTLRHHNTESKLCGKFYWEWTGIAANVVGMLFFVGALVTAVVSYHAEMAAAPASLWVSAVLMEPAGAFFGYGASYMAGLSRKDCRTIGIETGVQNFTLTIAIITLSFSGEARDDYLLFPILYGFMYVINSGWIILLLKYCLAPMDARDEKGGDKPAEPKTEEEAAAAGSGEVQLTEVVPV
jgi:bile acid transporter